MRNAQAAGRGPLYVVRDLPQMYTRELVALELVHHGCLVASLDVPLDAQQLNRGYAVVGFAGARAARHAVRALQGADFAFAPAALPMQIAPVPLPQAPRRFEYTCGLGKAHVANDSVESHLSASAQEFKPAAVAAPLDFTPAALAARGFLLPAPETVAEQDTAEAAWSCKDAAGHALDGACFAALDRLDLDGPVLAAPVWARYAALLASVPADEWGPDMLANFCAEELQQMYAQASVADAPLRTRPDLGAQFAQLGVATGDEAGAKARCGTATPPPTRSTSCSSRGSSPSEFRGARLSESPAPGPFALPRLLPPPPTIAQGA